MLNGYFLHISLFNITNKNHSFCSAAYIFKVITGLCELNVPCVLEYMKWIKLKKGNYVKL